MRCSPSATTSRCCASAPGRATCPSGSAISRASWPPRRSPRDGSPARAPRSRSAVATRPRSRRSRAGRCCRRRISACACRGRPFVLWGSVWAHPRGGGRHGSGCRSCGTSTSHADAVVTYGEHVRQYVTRYRGHADKDDVVIAPQSVEAELFGRAVGADEIAAWRAEAGLPRRPARALRRPPGGGEGRRGCCSTPGARSRPRRRVPTLVAIGDGPLAGELAATPGARLLGPLARERLPVAYAAAELLVLPSIPTPRFREPWGLVCNEALHQATPVVATTAVGAVAGGLVRDGETGLVVPPGDPGALADAIARLLGDAALGARARRRRPRRARRAHVRGDGGRLRRRARARRRTVSRRTTPRPRRARRGRASSRPRTRAASASSRCRAAARAAR